MRNLRHDRLRGKLQSWRSNDEESEDHTHQVGIRPIRNNEKQKS